MPLPDHEEELKILAGIKHRIVTFAQNLLWKNIQHFEIVFLYVTIYIVRVVYLYAGDIVDILVSSSWVGVYDVSVPNL